MFKRNSFFNQANQKRVLTPFEKLPNIIITITADPSTGTASVSTNVTLSLFSLISLLLHVADSVVKQWADQDSLIVGKSVALQQKQELGVENNGENTNKDDND